MWYIYTTARGNSYPLELGYRAVESCTLSHNYEKVTSFCKSGCDSYNSGGCPPWAPDFEDIQAQYKYVILVFGSFFSRHNPKFFRSKDITYLQYSFQDYILSNLFTQLGYEVKKVFKEDVLFLNSSHCMGCGEQKCSFLTGYNCCRNPERRTYAIGATGVEAASLLKNIFGIDLQWYGRDDNEVKCITKVMGFFCRERILQNQILDQIPDSLNSLKSSRFKIPTEEYNIKIRRLLYSCNL